MCVNHLEKEHTIYDGRLHNYAKIITAFSVRSIVSHWIIRRGMQVTVAFKYLLEFLHINRITLLK